MLVGAKAAFVEGNADNFDKSVCLNYIHYEITRATNPATLIV